VFGSGGEEGASALRAHRPWAVWKIRWRPHRVLLDAIGRIEPHLSCSNREEAPGPTWGGLLTDKPRIRERVWTIARRWALWPGRNSASARRRRVKLD